MNGDVYWFAAGAPRQGISSHMDVTVSLSVAEAHLSCFYF